MEEVHLRRMAAEEFETVYPYIENDFPPGERPPYAVFMQYIENGKVRLFGLFDQQTLLGYALILLSARYDFGMIWYLAVCPAFRNQSLGTTLLRLLNKEYADLKGMLIEVERVEDAATAEERMTRQRRVAFYEKSGYRPLSDYWILYGVPFRLMFLDYTGSQFDAVNASADAVYRSFYQENARITHIVESISPPQSGRV